MTAEPDPRTAADDQPEAPPEPANEGRSAEAPAEGSDAANPPGPGSPEGAAG